MTAVLIYNKKEDYLIIPSEAIRVRVIANSDNKDDIIVKEELKDVLNNELKILLKDVTTISDARKTINNNLKMIDKVVNFSLKELNYDKEYSINYGMNYFPQKVFNDVVYEDGYYESLVITLGEGKGSNYWCVLYPPLCEIGNDDNIEYKIYVKEIIDKYL